MKYHITHKTCYSYGDLTPVCHNLVHLVPRATARQTCLNYDLTIDPVPAFRTQRFDAFGNRADYFSIEAPHDRLEIVAEGLIEVEPPSSEPMDGKSIAWDDCVIGASTFRSNGSHTESVDPLNWQLSFPSPRVPLLPALRSYAAMSFRPRRSIVESIIDLYTRIHHEFRFDTRATTVDTPLAEVLTLRRGVCQDFAHLAVGCLRAMGLAARYTSGYLRTMPPPGKERLVGADASHAWCSCWCGPLGWIDFDPTNHRIVDDSYVTIAWGRDYGDVCPIQGVFVGQGEHRIRVSVDVAPQEAN